MSSDIIVFTVRNAFGMPQSIRHADGEQTVEEFDKEYTCKLAPRYFRFSL